MSAAPSNQSHCYICGRDILPVPKEHEGPLQADHATPDHVPPKGLFDTPKPDNLITVWAFHACNSRHSGFDERLRVLAASELHSNSAGKRIFMRKVIGSTMQKGRQFQFLAPIVQSFSSASVQTPHGPLPITKFRAPNPNSDVQLGVQSMVKGLLAHFYPRFDYHAHYFSVMDYHTATLARPGGAAVTGHFKTGHEWALQNQPGRGGVFILG